MPIMFTMFNPLKSKTKNNSKQIKGYLNGSLANDKSYDNLTQVTINGHKTYCSKVNRESLIEIYFGRHYRSPDVLVVAGLTLILIGFGAVLIGLYVYLHDSQFHPMTFLVGAAMTGIGLICCSCRIILFGPPISGCCSNVTPIYRNNKRRPTNPPFFTAASSAMSTVTLIGIRYKRGQSLSGVSQIINDDSCECGLGETKGSAKSVRFNGSAHRINHVNSFESIESIRDADDVVTPINPSVLQYIVKFGSRK